MIPITFYLFYLLVVLFGAGTLGNRLLQAFGSILFPSVRPGEAELDLGEILLLGIIVITTLVSAISLFHPVDLKIHAAISILAVAGGGICWWQVRKRAGPNRLELWRWPLLPFAGAWLGCLVFVASAPTNHYDTGLYHVQMVKWNTQFGVVPGLTNLNPRLGLNSAWDVFSSFIDQGYFRGHAFHIVNLLITVIFLVACFRGFQEWLAGNRSTSTALRCLGVFVILRGYRTLVPSLSTDWPIELLLYYTVILVAEWVERRAAANGPAAEYNLGKAGLIAAVCAFTVTVKLTGLTILLLFFLLLAPPSPNRWRLTPFILIPAICAALPFVGRNLVLTGYPIFPLATPDWFAFDWKVPGADIQFYQSFIKYWLINPSSSWYRVADMSFSDQLRTWLENQGSKIVPLIHWFCIGLFTWVAVGTQARVRARTDFRYYTAICGILLVGIVVCLLKVPEPRFARAWCVAFGLFPVAWLVSHVANRGNWNANVPKLLCYALLAISLLWLIRNAGVNRFIYHPLVTLWKLQDLPIVRTKEMQSEYGVMVRVPVSGELLWNAELPSAPLVNSALQMRGHTLKEGFRVTKPISSDWRRYFEQREPH